MDARVGSPMRAATRAIDAVVTIASPPEVHSTTPAFPLVRSRPECQRAAEACGLRPQANDSAVARGWHKPLNSLEREGQSQANAVSRLSVATAKPAETGFLEVERQRGRAAAQRQGNWSTKPLKRPSRPAIRLAPNGLRNRVAVRLDREIRPGARFPGCEGVEARSSISVRLQSGTAAAPDRFSMPPQRALWRRRHAVGPRNSPQTGSGSTPSRLA